MEDLLLHPTTVDQLTRLQSGNAHAVVIVGPAGSGKGTLGLRIAASMLADSSTDKLQNHPYFQHIVPEGKDITIDQIRSLQKFLTLKTTGKQQIRRIALIESADKMNMQAQNAILKTLEEPPADTLLLLTAVEIDQLLPTIRSRTQTLYLREPGLVETIAFFKAKGYAETDIKRTYGMSGGAVALMTDLLGDNTTNPLIESIQTAKDILSKSAYERLVMVEVLSKDKDATSGLLTALKRICLSTVELVALKSDVQSTMSWHRRLETVLLAEEANAKNANQKLLLTDLFIKL